MATSKHPQSQPLPPEDQPQPGPLPTEGDEVREVGKRAGEDATSGKKDTTVIPSFKKYRSGNETSNKVFQYFMVGTMGALSALGAKATVQGKPTRLHRPRAAPQSSGQQRNRHLGRWGSSRRAIGCFADEMGLRLDGKHTG